MNLKLNYIVAFNWHLGGTEVSALASQHEGPESWWVVSMWSLHVMFVPAPVSTTTKKIPIGQDE